MRVRQVALVARELESVVADLCAVFDLEVAFRDPGVAAFGLHNAVMPVGGTFLEVVSPVRAGTTAGRFLDKQGGDGGYMVIVQTADLDGDRRRLAALGVRIVWEVTLDDIATVHLHPRDVGGAILSLDQPRPPASWRWSGPGWESKVRSDVVGAITSVTLEVADPARIAARWAEVLGLPGVRETSHGLELVLDPGVIRVRAAEDRADGMAAVGLAAIDPRRAVATARARGLPVHDGSVRIGGTRFDLE